MRGGGRDAITAISLKNYRYIPAAFIFFWDKSLSLLLSCQAAAV
jgi:hypothetical protein